jgi:GT2 family glycosyltransferase
MEISIIIVTFNSASFIEACLRSILTQVKGLQYELIVVDNASGDGTSRLVEARFPEVILIRNESNAGFARANNLGLSRACGEFVLLINPDTLWKRGELGAAIRFMKSHPEAGALGSRLVLPDGSWQKSHGNFPSLSREVKEAFFLPRVFPRSERLKGVYAYQDQPDPKPVDWISCTFFLCRRTLMGKIGFFDERYFMYYEDIDLSKRIRAMGKEIYYYPEVEVLHRQKEPALIDFGESPYVYFNKFHGLSFARTLRYILLMKTALRLLIFTPLALFSRRRIFREKLESNYRTFKFSLFRAPEIVRNLKLESDKRDDQNSGS